MATNKKNRLGRGLGALLGDVRQTTGVALTTPQNQNNAGNAQLENQPVAPATTGLKQLPIELLQPGRYQPRLNIDKAALEELADSIRSQGIIQPLLVRRLEPGQYEIIAGERRWRGAQLAGLTTVPAVVREISDQAAMAVALIENIQRQDLNCIEEARGFQRLIEEFGLTHEEVAESVGRSRAAITNTLRLLALPDSVRQMVESGQLGMGHARALLTLAQNQQLVAAKKVIASGLSVRATEHLAKRFDRTTGSPVKNAKLDNDIKQLEQQLSAKIGAAVNILSSGNRGKLVIHYHSLDELDGILARIK